MDSLLFSIGDELRMAVVLHAVVQNRRCSSPTALRSSRTNAQITCSGMLHRLKVVQIALNSIRPRHRYYSCILS